jgi:hypothetical protein
LGCNIVNLGTELEYIIRCTKLVCVNRIIIIVELV